jgi:hypothetical protein
VSEDSEAGDPELKIEGLWMWLRYSFLKLIQKYTVLVSHHDTDPDPPVMMMMRKTEN